MSTVVEQQISDIFLRLEALEPAVARLEAIIDETPEGRYTAVVEKLMADYGWTAEEATTNFNNLLNSLNPDGTSK